MGTLFTDVYDRFFGKVTDDMYLELTPRDTLKDLRQLIIDAVPAFEFPRKKLDYELDMSVITEHDNLDMYWEVLEAAGVNPDEAKRLEWEDLIEKIPEEHTLRAAYEDGLIQLSLGELDANGNGKIDDEELIIIDTSHFNEELTSEEINIIALLMLWAWLQRQVTSIENTRMKYSGSDFKMTSQANHLAKLITLQNEVRRQCTHMQRLYKRRKVDDSGYIRSNWSVLLESSALEE